jgi:hypothetical protein
LRVASARCTSTCPVHPVFHQRWRFYALGSGLRSQAVQALRYFGLAVERADIST